MKKRKKKARRVFDLTPNPHGGWLMVERNTRGVPEDADAVKAVLLKRARKFCKEHQPSQLVVRDKHGEIQIEYTYGDDPERSPG